MVNEIIVSCPHCNCYITIANNDINCGIFRHAVYKDTFKPIDPHATYEECQTLLKNNKIYGCCRPFEIKIINSIVKVNKCGYI